MDWEKLRRQLASEARDYLADLREIRDGLRSVEGWIALGLVVAAILMLAAWAIVSLGFNPPNDHITALTYKFGLRPCRPISNLAGILIFVDMIMLIFLTVVSLGNVFNMIRRVREGQPREPRDLVVSTSLMLAIGISGIFFMLWIC